MLVLLAVLAMAAGQGCLANANQPTFCIVGEIVYDLENHTAEYVEWMERNLKFEKKELDNILLGQPTFDHQTFRACNGLPNCYFDETADVSMADGSAITEVSKNGGWEWNVPAGYDHSCLDASQKQQRLLQILAGISWGIAGWERLELRRIVYNWRNDLQLRYMAKRGMGYDDEDMRKELEARGRTSRRRKRAIFDVLSSPSARTLAFESSPTNTSIHVKSVSDGEKKIIRPKIGRRLTRRMPRRRVIRSSRPPIITSTINPIGPQRHIPQPAVIYGETEREERRKEEGEREESSLGDERQFIAYDCSSPRGLTVVRSPDQMDCGKEITNIEESSQTKKALLLQKLSYIKSTAIQCSLRRSTLPFRCGDHSHATIVTHNIRLSQEIRLTKEECSTYYETNLYETASHPYEGGVRYTDHLIRMNATNVINYHSYGMTYYSSGNTWCYGADDYYEVSGSPGRENTNKIVEYTIDELEMREVTTLISTEGVVSLFDEEQQLPTDRCSVSAGGCSEQHATWIWNNPTSSDECLMRKAREIEVNVTTVVEADGTVKDLLIDNGRAIYLEKRDPTMDCGQLIYETNHRDLFVTFVTDYPPFHRAVPSSMMRWNIYSDLSDSYLAHFMEQRHMEMTHAVSSAICETEKKMTEKQFSILAARQNAAMSQETIGLGQGQFATASGEAWHLYRCKEIIVTALDLDECYDSLPVRLEQSDREDRMVVERAKQRLLVKEGLAEPDELVPLETLQYFREPVTGIITASSGKDDLCAPIAPILSK